MDGAPSSPSAVGGAEAAAGVLDRITMALDAEWAVQQIDELLRLTELQDITSGVITSHRGNRGTSADITGSAQVVEQIFDRVMRDISETDLFKQVFTLDPSQPGKPRLRIIPNDGRKTFENVHRGARALTEGCHAGMRDPARRVSPWLVLVRPHPDRKRQAFWSFSAGRLDCHRHGNLDEAPTTPPHARSPVAAGVRPDRDAGAADENR